MSTLEELQQKKMAQLKELISKRSLPHSILIYGLPEFGTIYMAYEIASSLLDRHVEPIESEAPSEVLIERSDLFVLRPMKSTGLRISQ